MIKVVFFGASNYSLPVLKKLLSLKKFSVPLVVTKTDKTFGRDQKITPNPVAEFCQKNHLPLIQIENFSEDCRLKIEDYKADLGLCVAFGPPFFDKKTINLFPLKIVNIHPSPLPKYRGATPGPWQIINGENESAVTFFQIDLLPDHGPIISSLPLKILPTDTAKTFYDRAFSLATDNLEKILNSYSLHPQKLTPQDHSKKSYFPKISKEKAEIDWQQPATKIDAFVRGLNPFPIAWSKVKNHQGNIYKIKIFSGKILNNQFVPEEVQIEGKTKTIWSKINPYYQLF